MSYEENLDQSAQGKRETQMFDWGFEKLGKNHDRAKENNYVTSSPLVNSRCFESIIATANVIKTRYHEIQKKAPGQEDKALKGVIERYQELDPDPKFGNDEMYPFALIAAAFWKSLMDQAFCPTSTFKRLSLKSELGKILYLQHRVMHYRGISKGLDLESEGDLKKLLENINRGFEDNGATYQQRLKRCDMHNEIDSGVAVIRRGRRSIGKVLHIPQNYRHEWDNFFREFAGVALLNLFCVPKGGRIEPEDQRLFIIEESGCRDGDNLVPTPALIDKFDSGALEQLKGKVYELLPLVEQPRDWTYQQTPGMFNQTGGYFSEGIRTANRLVRFNEGFNETVPSEFAVDFLNKVQKVEWAFDLDQLEIVKRVGLTWNHDFDGIKRPPQYSADDLHNGTGDALLIPEVMFKKTNHEQVMGLIAKRKAKTGDLTEPEIELLHQWNLNNQKLAELYRLVANRHQQVKSFASFVAKVQKSLDQTLWFSWSYDYRTRVYPLGSQGTPQGPAYERHSLCFANGQRLTKEGEKAALVAIGGAMIGTKGSITQRLEFAKDHLPLIRELAEGTDQAIEEAGSWDEPLYLLQLCNHWVRHETGGLWSAPIYADATCSGYQIVSALLNNWDGLKATNCLSATEDDLPQDAYSKVINLVIQRLLARQKGDPSKFRLKIKGITHEERQVILDHVSNYNGEYSTSSEGRKLSKAVAKTLIYGSSYSSQLDDVNDELTSQKVTLEEFPKKLRGLMVTEIAKGFTEALGSVSKFNTQVKQAARERLFEGCDPDDVEMIKLLNTDRTKAKSKGAELPKHKLNHLIQLGRNIKRDSTYGLKLTTCDESFLDMASYIKTTEILQTAFHGRPSAPVTHVDSFDTQSMIQATPPGLIHSIDSSILKFAFKDWEHPINLVHDSAGCLPNQFEEMKRCYRRGFLEATERNVLISMFQEWGVEPPELDSTDTSWRSQVMHATYMFN